MILGLPLIKAWKQNHMKKTHRLLKKKLKVALHLIHSNSFSTKKSWHIFQFDHKRCAMLIQKKLVRMAKNGVSQEYIGPLILEKIQMYILIRAELLYTLCHEIPCSNRVVLFVSIWSLFALYTLGKAMNKWQKWFNS